MTKHLAVPVPERRLVDLRTDELGAPFAADIPLLGRLLACSFGLGAAVLLVTTLVALPIGVSARGIVRDERSVPLVAPVDGVWESLVDGSDAGRHRRGEPVARVHVDDASFGALDERREDRYLQEQIRSIEVALDNEASNARIHAQHTARVMRSIGVEQHSMDDALAADRRALSIEADTVGRANLLASSDAISGAARAEAKRALYRSQGALHRVELERASLDERRATLELSTLSARWDSDTRTRDLKQSLATARRQLMLNRNGRTVELTMPFAGTLQEAGLGTGSGVQAGQTLLRAIPDDAELVFRADVPAEHIAEMRVGNKALIEITAYPSDQYGVIVADVAEIPALPRAPEIAEEGIPQHVRYSVRLVPRAASLERFTRERPLRSGMQFEVRTVSRYRTLLALFVRPLRRLFNQASA